MSHSFLKESKLYIVYGGNRYRIYTTTAISFSQTFAEDSYPVKTLHDQSKMFEGSIITTANPANFSYTIPLTLEKDESIVMDLITDLVAKTGDPESNASDRHNHDDTVIAPKQLKSFDSYIQTGSATFKIENCVVTSANFNFDPRDQFKVEIEGEGTKLTRVGNESYTIPGSAQSESATRTPLLAYPVISVDSLSMSSIISTTVQIQNSIEWTEFETLQESLSVTDSSNAMFPSAYTISNRIVSGAITQYQTDNNITQFDDFSTNSNITLKVVEVGKLSSDNGFFAININPAMYTARLESNAVYSQSYDFRSTDNTALSTRITQYS